LSVIHICSRRKNGIPPLEGFPVVYVGRGSPLGNPFKLNYESERDDVISKYREYINSSNLDSRQVKELVRIYKLYKENAGINLECWCAPKKCHAEIVVDFIRYMEENGFEL